MTDPALMDLTTTKKNMLLYIIMYHITLEIPINMGKNGKREKSELAK